MSAILTPIVALITQLLPLLGAATSASPLITQIIETLVAILPSIVQEAIDLVPAIKNIIAALSANPATTAEQMATLADLDAKCDAAFEAAAVDPSADS